MGEFISFQGAGANCGKTTTLVGILKSLAQDGVSVAPFKSVSILSEKSFGLLNSVQQLCQASNLKFDHLYNPVTIIPTSNCNGQLYLNGIYRSDIQLIATDTPLFMSIDSNLLMEIVEEIKNNIKILEQNFDYIFNEGASNPLDLILFENYDLSNYSVLESMNSAIILVVREYDGGHWAALLGTINNFPREYRHQIKGFILNDVINPNNKILQTQINSLSEKLNIKCFGVIPRVNYFDEINESTPDLFEAEYNIWAKIAREFINIKELISLMDTEAKKC